MLFIKKSPQTKQNHNLAIYLTYTYPTLTLAILVLRLMLMSRPSVRPHAAPAKLTNLTLLSETGRRFYILQCNKCVLIRPKPNFMLCKQLLTCVARCIKPSKTPQKSDTGPVQVTMSNDLVVLLQHVRVVTFYFGYKHLNRVLQKQFIVKFSKIIFLIGNNKLQKHSHFLLM